VEGIRGPARHEIRDDSEAVDIRDDTREGHEGAIPPAEGSRVRDKPAGKQMGEGIHTRRDRRE
ncbi:MAG: hypothetical protein ACYTEY_01265, partial [Planctomycetota bacterium]